MTFLGEPTNNEVTRAAFERDLEAEGFVYNYTRLWAWAPGLSDTFADLRGQLMDASPLGDHDWALLVTTMASELNDSYCSLAWGPQLAELFGTDTATQVLAGDHAPGLSSREAALRDWTRKIVRDPNGTTEKDVAVLRAAGITDKEIFDATAFVAFRMALAMVNDALGAAPDQQLAASVPEPLRKAVTYGRAVSTDPSPATTTIGARRAPA